MRPDPIPLFGYHWPELLVSGLSTLSNWYDRNSLSLRLPPFTGCATTHRMVFSLGTPSSLFPDPFARSQPSARTVISGERHNLRTIIADDSWGIIFTNTDCNGGLLFALDCHW